ncbi:MarR family transcriptional regulator [Clostridioides difficile]|nr:MarR family transcriptional regulator [Clostridioides difficile]
MRTYNKWHEEIKKQLKILNLTHPQFVVLTTLGYLTQSKSEVTQVMIAKFAGMDVMSTSQIINLLEKHELISRKEHSKDTRAKSVNLTTKGQDIIKKAIPIVEKIDNQFFGTLNNEEEVFINLLHKLSNFDCKE